MNNNQKSVIDIQMMIQKYRNAMELLEASYFHKLMMVLFFFVGSEAYG